MASSGEVVDRMAEVAQVLPSTVDRGLRPMREAGFVPMGAAGRGKTQGQYDHTHVNNVVLGLGADTPADAASAVRLLRDTYCDDLPPPDDGDDFWSWLRFHAPPPIRFQYDGTDDGESRINAGAFLDRLTLALARMSPEDRSQYAAICQQQDVEIRLCLAPASLTVAWRWFREHKEVRYSSGDTPLGALFPSTAITAPRRRVTIFPMAIFAVAGELAGDSLGRVRPSLDFPPSGSTPENEEAPVLPGTSASNKCLKPRGERLARPLDKAEVKWQRANAQARCVPARHIPTRDGAADHEFRP